MSPEASSPPRAHRWHQARKYDDLSRMFQARNAELVARLHPEPTGVGRAYEIGCGTGGLTRALARTLPAASIDAVDVSPDMLAVAGERSWPGRVRFSLAEFPDPGAPSGYDAVFSNAALHWTHPRYEEAFAAVARMLRPGGLFCAATAGRSAASEGFDEMTRGALDALGVRDPDPFGARRLSVDELSSLADRAGLRTQDAFLVERSADVTVRTYAEWWISSGAPWTADAVAPREAVRIVSRALGGAERPITVVHTSVVAVLLRTDGGSGA